jgi:hypothetical protein
MGGLVVRIAFAFLVKSCHDQRGQRFDGLL